MLTRYTKLVPVNSPLAFGISAGCVAAATAIQFALGAFIGPMEPLITMFPAVLFAAVIGGLGPGLLAILLSAIAAQYFFIGSPLAFDSFAADLIGSILYVLVTLLVVLTATSMRRAVERLETAQEKLLTALDASGTGTWRWDMQRNTVEWDPAMSNVFDLAPDQVPRTAEEFRALVHPDDRERVRRVVEQAVGQGTAIENEFRTLLPDRAERWIYDRSRIVHDGEGQPLYMIGACLDITERKRAEERQGLLIHELNHRVKNTLATVQSLATQTIRSSRDPEAFQANFMARLMALSATHDILTQKFWESASLDEVLAAELRPYGGIDQQRIRADGEPVQLKPQQALSLGMAFHELATNAAKYGALSSPQGHIEISWDVASLGTGERQLVLLWREQGGPAVNRPRQQGFGTRLIDRSIIHELGGTIETDFAPTGVVCLFKAPLSAA